MEERTIVRVERDGETEDAAVLDCMYCPDGHRCGDESVATIITKYDDEPDKEFHTDVCESCLHKYTTAVDTAQTFGDEALAEQ